MTAGAPRGHAVVVLAAGASSRLGQPKQLLRINGETLLHRMVRLARSTTPGAVVAVLPPDADLLREALAGQPCTLAINPDPGRGMRSSLDTAAPYVAEFAQVLVITCDQPALEAAHLHALLRGASNASSGCAATRSTPTSRRDTPCVSTDPPNASNTPGVPAVIPGPWFTHLTPGTPDSGFRARLRALPASSLFLLEAPGLALDIDTPEHLRTARDLGLIDPA